MNMMILLDATSPLNKFKTWLDSVNAVLGTIGPAIGILCIAISVFLICFSNGRETQIHVRKIVTICIAIGVLANAKLIIDFATTLVSTIFG